MYESDYQSRLQFVFGHERMQKLGQSSVLVVGVGGVGSNCAVSLARGGVGKLILVDGDEVQASNMNRQAIAYEETIGMRKVDAACKILRQAAPETDIETIDAFLLEDSMHDLFARIGQCDFIVDAIDTVSTKLALVQYAQDHKIPLICCLGTAQRIYPELFKFGDIFETRNDPLARVLRRECRKRGIRSLSVLYSEEEPVQNQADCEPGDARPPLGSTSFCPAIAGYLIAGFVIRRLCGLER